MGSLPGPVISRAAAEAQVTGRARTKASAGAPECDEVASLDLLSLLGKRGPTKASTPDKTSQLSDTSGWLSTDDSDSSESDLSETPPSDYPLLHKPLTRLDTLDLDHLRLSFTDSDDSYDGDSDDSDEEPPDIPHHLANAYTDACSDAETRTSTSTTRTRTSSATPSCSNSTPVRRTRPPTLATFFDATSSSAEPSPTSSTSRTEPQQLEMPAKTSELAGPVDNTVGSALFTSTYSTIPAGPIAGHNMTQWRPRSARSLWSRKHQPLDVDEAIDVDMVESDDSLDSDPKLEKFGPADKGGRSSNSRTKDLNKELPEMPSTTEGVPAPPLTREEFEALPLAIQRKVRTFCVWCCIVFVVFLWRFWRSISCLLLSSQPSNQLSCLFDTPD